MIKIGEKAKQVLKYISLVNEGVIINDKSLYTKYEESIETKSAGQPNIIVEYVLPEGEIEVQENFGLFYVKEFLNVLESFPNDTVKMEQEGNTIVMSDDRKSVHYYTNGVDSLPVANPTGKQIFDNAESTAVFALTEADIQDINKDLKLLNFDKLILKAKDDKLVLTSDDSIASHNTEITINSKMVSKASGTFEFPNTNIFSVLMPDSYKVVIKEAEVNGNIIKICRLEAVSVEGLSYLLVSA